MSREQRLFSPWTGFLGFVALFLAISCPAADEPIRRGERFNFAEGRLSVVLPNGWDKTELNAADVVAGYATQDNRTSLFIRQILWGLLCAQPGNHQISKMLHQIF